MHTQGTDRKKEKDLARRKDAQQFGVGLYRLHQGDQPVGRLLVLEDGSRSVQHWELSSRFIQPSWVNTDELLRFEYVGEPIDRLDFERAIHPNSQYVLALCELVTR